MTASSTLPPPPNPTTRTPFHLSSAQTIQREVGGAELDATNPEQPPTDLTGRYEVINPDGKSMVVWF